MWGFKDIKDLLDVVLVPAVLFALGVWVPIKLQQLRANQKKDAFIKLIRRELKEMQPDSNYSGRA